MEPERKQGLVGAARRLREAERPVRILSSLAWEPRVREAFFAQRAERLPEPEYRPFEGLDGVLRAIDAAVGGLGEGEEERWLVRQAETIGWSARMLSCVATPAFFDCGRRIYGAPREPLHGTSVTVLDLAQRLDTLCAELAGLDLGAPAPACHLASDVARRLERAVRERFGAAAPEVVVVDELSANAIAGPKAIRVRRSACFSDRDVLQLIAHEAYVHVCTSLNGRQQTELPILAAGHAGTTRTQEGLAVFAELLSGSMDPDRFRRLGDRVLAVQMAIEGADFLDVYRFFLERTANREQAYENARRVFRGGVLTGGAPFMKDVVYLDGLLRVTNFLRVAVEERRADSIVLLFCGKLDLDDLPVLSRLSRAGLLRPPRFLPPWIEDRRFLVASLAFSNFLDRMDLEEVRRGYRDLFDAIAR